ncbi:MAG: glycosyltransferase [Phycisphaerae bacterium]|nr:glycosyltransferase [Phycisphaerae bacterium]
MTFENIIYLIVLILCVLTSIQGISVLRGEVRFYRYVARMVAQATDLLTESGEFKCQPRVAVILPCCGVDEKLGQTVRALSRQNYADYEVIFAFESSDDPAYAAVGAWIKDLFQDSCAGVENCGTDVQDCGTGVPPVSAPPRRRCHNVARGHKAPLDQEHPRCPGARRRRRCLRVVAGLADRRAQKIHNLLAAVEQVSDDREALVFLDSDAVPGEDWLGHLVAPLGDRTVGAATGYRWYGATGGIAAGVRCAWNASTVSLLEDERRNFCWGGATAIRKETFESLDVSRYWDHALSDDYQLTRAIRGAGLRIRFVPQALVPSSDRTTLRAFWSFARRQILITRVCGPAIWRAGLMLTCNFVVGGTMAAVLFLVAAMGWFGSRTAMFAALFAWLFILALAVGKAVLRQLAVRKVLRPPDWTWRDFWWDVLGTVAFSGPLHLNLFAASLTSRRIVWRNTEYELVSADETRVVRRLDSGS